MEVRTNLGLRFLNHECFQNIEWFLSVPSRVLMDRCDHKLCHNLAILNSTGTDNPTQEAQSNIDRTMTKLNFEVTDQEDGLNFKEQAIEQPITTTASSRPWNNDTTAQQKKTIKTAACLLLSVLFGGFMVWGVASLANTAPVVTDIPSTAPSDIPSSPPSISHQPSDVPSFQPSEAPSNAPTIEALIVDPNPVPSRRARSYFNYDIKDGRYGPNRWRNINMDGTYYQEFGAKGFGTWKGHLRYHVSNPQSNRCGSNGKQSPIDLKRTKGSPGRCLATHQIRTRVRPLNDKSVLCLTQCPYCSIGRSLWLARQLD